MGAAISREVESSVVAVPLTRHHVMLGGGFWLRDPDWHR